MPSYNRWSLKTADGVLASQAVNPWVQEMYVTKGDTWVVEFEVGDYTVGHKITLHQLTLEQARARWYKRLGEGWTVTRCSRPWKRLMGDGNA